MQERGGQLRAYAAAERLSRALGDISQAYLECLGPTAKALGSKLGITPDTCSLFPEEVRASADPGRRDAFVTPSTTSGMDSTQTLSAIEFATNN